MITARVRSVAFGESSTLERICADVFLSTLIESLSIPDTVGELSERLMYGLHMLTHYEEDLKSSEQKRTKIRILHKFMSPMSLSRMRNSRESIEDWTEFGTVTLVGPIEARALEGVVVLRLKQQAAAVAIGELYDARLQQNHRMGATVRLLLHIYCLFSNTLHLQHPTK